MLNTISDNFGDTLWQSRGKIGFHLIRPRQGFDFHRVWIFLMSVTDWLLTQHAKRKSGRSGGSGLFPAIKTALVDVCHRKKVRGITILKGYGELGLGWPRKDGFHSDR